jgi:predicted DCC family thiol-disulfide oxidoreductase YuxK
MERIYKIVNKSFFPAITSVELEQRKLGVIRILFGILLFARFSQAVYSSFFFERLAPFQWFGFATLLVILLFTIGFATPIITFLLMLMVIEFDFIFHCSTLGTNVLSQILFVLIFTGHGRFFSLDRIILKSKSGKLKTFVEGIYNRIGNPNAQKLRLLYLIVFVSYAVLSFVALSFHLMDDSWIHGKTVYLFFTGAFLSKYYATFREVQASMPGVFMFFSAVMIIGQSIFQFFMLPLMWFRWGRFFVLFWGFAFFIACFFLINLSYLPHVELLGWLAIFTRMGNRTPIRVLYDDRCNFCKKSIWVIRQLNINGSLDFVGLSKASGLIEQYKLDPTDVKIWMYGIGENAVYKGYDLYYEIVKRNGLLWVLVPLFFVGKYTRVGYWIYSLIAKRRYKLAGMCEISTPYSEPKLEVVEMTQQQMRRIFIFYTAVVLIFVSTKLPYLNERVSPRLQEVGLGRLDNALQYSLEFMGMVTPIVFNETDLKMNEKYFVLKRINADGEEVVPIMNQDGARMQYLGVDLFNFKNHGSDILYFGNTLKYQRWMIPSNPVEFHQDGMKGDKVIRKLIAFDEAYRGQKSSYALEIWQNESMSRYDKDRFESHLVFRKEYLMD